MMGFIEAWRLDELVNAGRLELGRGDIISKEDIEKNPGAYPIYSSSAKGEGKFGEYGNFMFNEELVTWSVDGGGNFFYRNKHKYSVTNVCGFMRVKDSALDCRFLFFSLVQQHRYFSFDYTTKAHPSVIKKMYHVPKFSYGKQKKIATILSTIDSAIEHTEALIEKYQNVKTGLMQDLFTRGLLPNGQLRPPREQAPELYQKTDIGWIPRDWSVEKLANLTSKIVDGVHHTPSYVEHGIPFVTVRNLTFNRDIDFTRLNYISPADHLQFSKRVLPQAGDVLVTKDGTLGVSRIVKSSHPEFSIFVSVALLRPVSSRITSSWLHYFFDANLYLKQLAYLSAGTGLKHIHLEHFRKFKVPLPATSEQQLIHEKIVLIENYLSNERGRLEKLSLQKLGLMQDLLTGNVPVPIDDAQEEPASTHA